MKKFLPSCLYWGLCGALLFGIVKALGVSKLFAFSHSLDVHADEEAIKREAEKRIRQEAEERKRIAEEKEKKEQEEKERKEKEERERKRKEEEDRRKEEEKIAFEEWKREETKRIEDLMKTGNG